MKKVIIMLLSIFMLSGCSSMKVENTIEKTQPENTQTEKIDSKEANNKPEGQSAKKAILNVEGGTIEERFAVPVGFQRVSVEQGSFEEYLRKLPLRPHGSKVLYYDGKEKANDGVYEAVVEGDIGKRDLHQCADAVMLLKAEYLYKKGNYEDIHFNFVNGFKAEYSKWRQGWRIKVTGNNATWIKGAPDSNNYESFRRFMDMVFAYAGTLSLEKELKLVDKKDMQIGDVFIKGASPGHAIIVVDMAVNKENGEKLFMLAQSYMPAQQTQILSNNSLGELSPWYSLNYEGELNTPQWVFDENSLRRWQK